MSSWVEKNANQEVARRNEVKAFMQAYHKFLSALTPLLNAEIDEFRKHFPADTIKWSALSPEVTEISHDFGGTSFADVRLHADPIRKVFIFEFGISPALSKMIPATVHGDELLLDLSSNAIVSMAELVEYILFPVLFPGHVSDPETLRHLKPRFGAY